MKDKIKCINNKISFMPSSENPLSADVYVVSGGQYSYIIDVGSSDSALELLDSIDKKKIIITHFHDDHMKNLARINVSDEDLYVGEQSRKVLQSPAYTGQTNTTDNTSDTTSKQGTLVTSPTDISDGVRLRIVPIPSSHAKGSLAVIVDDEYLFMGDSFYCSSKGYNVSLLYDEIKLLKEISFAKVIMSHDEKIYDRDEVISELEEIYSKKEKGNPFIKVD